MAWLAYGRRVGSKASDQVNALDETSLHSEGAWHKLHDRQACGIQHFQQARVECSLGPFALSGWHEERIVANKAHSGFVSQKSAYSAMSSPPHVGSADAPAERRLSSLPLLLRSGFYGWRCCDPFARLPAPLRGCCPLTIWIPCASSHSS
jgi:hypothetical protein